VTDSFPELDEIRQKNAASVIGDDPPTLGATLTHAASPVAMAVHSAPRPAPARQPTLPPMPAVMVPQHGPPGKVLPTTMRLHPGAPPPTSVPVSPAHPPPSWGQAPAQPSMSNEYPAPGGYGPPASAQSGPVDMQRLFAPPIPNDQRTITAQALKKRIPVWAVAVASAVVGLLAFGLVVLVLTHTSAPDAPGTGGAAASASAPTTPVVAMAHEGPFMSARAQFAATLASVPAPTHDTVAPSPPAAPSAAPAPPPADSTPAPPPIATVNVAALPTTPSPPVAAGAAHAPPARNPAPAPATSTAGTGTLKVICFPGCDQVIDNGAALGPSPIVRRNTSLGSHRIKLVWSDTSKVVSTIVIADQTATVRENHP
jgi:hypothetical protein